MKTIRTRYLGPTNYKPSRIKASDSDGNSITVSYDYDADNPHWEACKALMEKLGWKGEMCEGGFGCDVYWNFVRSREKHFVVW